MRTTTERKAKRMSTTEPPVTALRSYMRATGWAEGMQGSLGSVFTKGGVKVAVPLEDYDQDLTRISLNRLAQAEGRTPEDTAAAVLAHRDGAVSLDDGECDRLRALMAGRGAEADAEGLAGGLDRESLGRIVHGVRLKRNAERERPFGLLPWGERDARQQELDRCIGEAVTRAVMVAMGAGEPQERTDEKGPA